MRLIGGNEPRRKFVQCCIPQMPPGVTFDVTALGQTIQFDALEVVECDPDLADALAHSPHRKLVRRVYDAKGACIFHATEPSNLEMREALLLHETLPEGAEVPPVRIMEGSMFPAPGEKYPPMDSLSQWHPQFKAALLREKAFGGSSAEKDAANGAIAQAQDRFRVQEHDLAKWDGVWLTWAALQYVTLLESLRNAAKADMNTKAAEALAREIAAPPTPEKKPGGKPRRVDSTHSPAPAKPSALTLKDDDAPTFEAPRKRSPGNTSVEELPAPPDE